MRSIVKYSIPSRREGTKKMSKTNAKRDESRVGIKHVNRNALGRLMKIIVSNHRGTLIVVMISILVTVFTNVANSMFLSTLIDDYITPMLATGSRDFSGLDRALATMMGIYAAGILAAFTFRRLMVNITQGTLNTIRGDMFAHMQRLPIRYFDTHSHGSIMSRYTNDTDTLRQMISESIPQIFSASITIVAVFCAMVYTSVPLTIFTLLTLGVMMFTSGQIGKRSGKYFIRQQNEIGEVNGYIEEMIEGQRVVQVFCHEEQAKAGFDAHNEALCDAMTKANTYANILMPAVMSLGNLQYALIALLGGALAINGIGGTTLGTVAAFMTLSKSFNMPISQVSQQLNSIVMALAGAERIFDLMDEEPETDEGNVTLVNARFDQNDQLVEADGETGLWAWKVPHKEDDGFDYVQLKGEVRFYDVDFGYNPDKIVLHDVSLYAEPGQKIAFVGATGAGKTTITNLINRFYDIADGKIRYDGININKIKKGDLRRSLGIVLQDVSLFTGTIRENIRYGKLTATDEEVYAAAQLAGADSFIHLLPDGYDTVLTGGGTSLSQGQRQLLSIARAAVADPPVMILVEATSSFDTRTEAIVQQGMDSLMYGRTVFVIAHRLSTIRNSDVIMVLDQGHIIERGNHEKLLAEKGTYYQLYTGAFELD